MPCTRWRGPNFYVPLRPCPLRSRMRRFEDGKLSAIDNFCGKRWLRRTIQTHCWPWHAQPGLQCTETGDQKCSSIGTGRSSITTGPTMLRNTRSKGETRSLTDVAHSTEAGGKRNGAKKSSIRPSSSDWRSFLSGPRENGGCEGVDAKWPRSDQLELERGPLATAPTNKLLHRITKELAKGKARRAVPPWSIPREIWLMVLRPRDPDMLETNMPTATETDLNNRLLQTTSSKQLLAIMREIREKPAANSEAPNQSRPHLPSVPKPCGIGYHALISGLLGYNKGGGITPDTWQKSAPVPLD